MIRLSQVVYNFKWKSTEGWSVYFSWLDLVGGLGSVAQMILTAENEGEWANHRKHHVCRNKQSLWFRARLMFVADQSNVCGENGINRDRLREEYLERKKGQKSAESWMDPADHRP